jgi:hypothetical protein
MRDICIRRKRQDDAIIQIKHKPKLAQEVRTKEKKKEIICK